ncbi:hypothetical protein Ait01nite_051850 [Actinoplanes italicus]|jgi:hypothetical protein|uniref:Uncharacterized protein n=1 Tax=Actinoplanes italicus TaxID=113567 RepID=A0A2T0K008_9ACTN|nr:hypothetical protein [Actinoplanes italicus]PRX16102.1 hypothetical protein CLV67_121150 [Actinoplanes italicus]GIE32140.1 hypothetical protein Ait01nite_051850 [Actinoplanes italicus]
MYAWIWRKFPGGVWSKLTFSLVLVSAVGTLLWYVIFPWATPLLPFDDVQVEAGTGQDAGGAIPGDEGAAEEPPYSTTSNQPKPSPSR